MRWTAIVLFPILFPLNAISQSEMPKIDYGVASYGGGISYYGAYGIPAPALQLPRTLAYPEMATFVPYNNFQRLSGLTVDDFSINKPLMLVNMGGYMELYGRNSLNVGLTGSRRTYTSFGFSNRLSMGASYAPTEWVTFYGSVYVSDNAVHMDRFKNLGVSGRMRVKVAERIYVNGYGQYSAYNNSPHILPMGMYPATSYGGTIEVKITDKFGIEGGAFREYDPFTRKWKTHYYVSPVFY